jgi:hypothetical protein
MSSNVNPQFERANKSMEPTRASGSGQLQSLRQWPLAPAAHAQRSEMLRTPYK